MSYDAVFAAQQQAYLDGALEPLDKRIAVLKSLQNRIKEREEKLYAAFYVDLHKSRQQVYLSELLPVYCELQFFLKNMRRLFKPEKVHYSMMFWNTKSVLLKRPVGPVLIIAPFNYPLNLAFAPLVGALACGCPCTLLMSPHTPAIRGVISEIVAFFGREMVHLEEDREQLFPRPFGCVFFTGSIPVGRIIHDHCAKYLSRCVLELGGCNPLFLTRSADIKQTAEQVCMGKFFNAGQTCIAPNFVLAERGCERHIYAIVDLIKIKYKTAEHCCKVIGAAKYSEMRYILASRKVIYEHKFDSQIAKLGSANDEEMRILAPALIEALPEDEILTKELFANVLPVVYFDSHAQAVDFYRNLFYKQNLQARPLAAYLFSEDKSQIDAFPAKISAGTISVNQCLLFLMSQLPFGGVGEAGIGRYHGKYSLECFTHEYPCMVVRKHYLAGFGYKANSFGASTSSPPFPQTPDSMVRMALAHNLNPCSGTCVLAIFLLLWAVGVTIALVIVLVK